MNQQTTELVRAGEMLPAMTIESAIARYNEVLNFTQKIMKPEKDYGKIPGTDKPTLLKPGAEKLCSFFGLAVDYVEVSKTLDWAGGLFFFEYKAVLTRHGQLIATGIGSCNSYEKKYRWRWVSESDLPPGVDKSKLATRSGTLREFDFAVEKAETSGKYGKPAAHWQRFKDAIAAGAARNVEVSGKKYRAWEIGGTLYRVQNEDLADVLNTVQKMAQKRALIGAVLIAANASEFYTQDIEDMDFIEGEAVLVAAPKAEPTYDPFANLGEDDREFLEMAWDVEIQGRKVSKEAGRELLAALLKRAGHAHLSNLNDEGREQLIRRAHAGEFDSRPAIATAEQVRELKELLSIVRLPEGTTDKWFAKAGVDTWEDMPAETVAKCLDYVKGRLPGMAAA